MRHVLTLLDLSGDEIRRVLEVASDLKQHFQDGVRPPVLERRVMGMLFEKPSLRTRVSFESLMRHAGGSSLFLGDDVGWGTREPMRDFIPILTRYIDCLVIRARRHEDVQQATEFSNCPIINGLTDRAHPCQALADMMTMQELVPEGESIGVAYLGDANNVAFSLALICARLNVPFAIGAPAGYQFDATTQKRIRAAATSPDWSIVTTDDPIAAVRDANFVYTDVWASMGQEAEQAERAAALAPYQVNTEIMAAAGSGARFLHCLPARRGEEVVAEVIDGPASAVIQQAENRLHAQKGLVVWLLTESESMAQEGSQ